MLARIAAENYTSSTFNVSDYLNATPREVRSTIQLSAGELSSLLGTHLHIARLLEYSRQHGYVFLNNATHTVFNTGEETWSLYMLAPGDGSPAILSGDDNAALVEVYRGDVFILFDETGGFVRDQVQGTLEPFGSWADISWLF